MSQNNRNLFNPSQILRKELSFSSNKIVSYYTTIPETQTHTPSSSGKFTVQIVLFMVA